MNLGIDFKRKNSNSEIKKYNYNLKLVNEFRKWENNTFQLLCDYLHILWEWEKLQDFENELFIDALQNKDYIDYLIYEYFIYGTDEDKIWFWKNEREFINKINTKLSRIKQKGDKNE